MPHQSSCRLRCHSPTPVWLAEPVTKLPGVEVVSISRNDADSTDGFAFEIDCEENARAGVVRDSYPIHRILVCVRVGEHVCQVTPDKLVVPVLNKRIVIASVPGTKADLGVFSCDDH